jgi:FRG domain
VTASHEASYRAYVELIGGRPPGERAHLDDVVRGARRAALVEHLGLIDSDDLVRARELGGAWRAARDADRASAPFGDAYQAGLWLHLTEDQFFRHAKPHKLYRGQRNATWPTSASLFRNADRDPPPRERRQRLISLAGRLTDRLGLDPAGAFAAAQHYGGEASLPGGLGPVTTWFLDVTWNPFIALAFATHWGADGDVGVVAAVDVDEWNGKLGSIADIDVLELDLLRPHNQEAAFIDSAFPELADDYLPLAFQFFQHAGVRFADPFVDITARSIYPQDDPAIPIVKEWAQEELAGGEPPVSCRTIQLPDHVVLRPEVVAPGWVPFTVFRDLVHRSLAQLDTSPDLTNETLPAHIELLSVFHSQARHQNLRPGLGGLGAGAWIAYQRDRDGRPPSLREMTTQYNLVYDEAFQTLVQQLDELWRQGGPAWATARQQPGARTDEL